MAATPDPQDRAPYLGAVVLFVDPGMGDTSPAVVTRVLPEHRVRLTVFPTDAPPFPLPAVAPHDETVHKTLKLVKGSWHWPF